MTDDKVVDPCEVSVEPKGEIEVASEKRKQLEKNIIYYPLGEQLDLAAQEPDIEQLDLSQTRLVKIESFAKFTNLKSVCFRQNLLKTLATGNLKADQGFSSIKELDFYDNQIEKIENLNELVTLEILDLSFNHFKKIENLENLVNLRKLFLVHNKITQIENLNTFQSLEMLELGDNQIRTIDNLEILTNLKELYIGKNKIKKIENLNLPKLEILSIQSNRITKLENLSHLVNLEELYISDNGLTCIEGLDSLKSLKVLDLSNNQIERIENMQGMVNLEEFWFSNNNLKNWEDLEKLTQLSKLKCLYLEHNPIYYISNKKPSIIVVDSQVNSSDYRRKVVMTLPNLEQLDATPCKRPSLNTASIL